MFRLSLKATSIPLLVLLIHLGLLMFRYPSVASEFLAASLDKRQLLENHAAGTVILLGGSSTAFGYDSAALAEELQRPVINAGLHGGLGLRYALNTVAPYVQNGDTLILNLEYTHYLSSPDIKNSDTLRRLMGIDFWANSRLMNHWGQWWTILRYNPEYTLEQSWAAARGRDRQCNEVVYCRSSFNELGDIRSDLLISNTASNTNLLNRIAAEDLSLYTKPLDGDAITLLNDFAAVSAAHGARLFIVLPPLPEAIVNPIHGDLLRIVADLEEAVPIQIINPVAAYPQNLFFDTIYHLNRDGIARHTTEVAAFLQAHLK